MLKFTTALVIGGVFFLVGCEPNSDNYSHSSSDQGVIHEGPFEVRYLTSQSAEVKYEGRLYQISNAVNHDEYPFRYSFEDDGDIDLILNGREYEVENPEDEFDDAMEDLFSKKHKPKGFSHKPKTQSHSASASLFSSSKPVTRTPVKSQSSRRK